MEPWDPKIHGTGPLTFDEEPPMTDNKPIALEVDGKQWEKIGGRWKYRHRRGWVVPPETFGVFLDAIADRAARIAELGREAVKAADRLHEARSDSHKLARLRTAIRGKAERWKQQAKNYPEMRNYYLERAAELLAMLEEGK